MRCEAVACPGDSQGLSSIDCSNYAAHGEPCTTTTWEFAVARAPAEGQNGQTHSPDMTNAFGNYDVGEDRFNEMFAASRNLIAKRECPGCAMSHRIIFYRRLAETPAGFSVYDTLMDNWFSNNNVLNVDMQLFSTYEDALARANPWQYCNYDDAHVGFPRDCGPAGHVGMQWNSLSDPGIQHWRWSIEHVEVTSVISSSVDFIMSTFPLDHSVAFGCQCKPGYEGAVVASIPSDDAAEPYVGDCLPIPCPDHTTEQSTSTLAGCICEAGYHAAYSSVPRNIFASGLLLECHPVDCPPFSTGDNIPSGCVCEEGYSGTISPEIGGDGRAYYSGSCGAAQLCDTPGQAVLGPFAPVASPLVLVVNASNCLCPVGYTASVQPSDVDERFYCCSECTPVSCPANSIGESVESGCMCNQGYSGSIQISAAAQGYSGQCVPIDCPAGSLGDNVPSGCVCTPGHEPAWLAAPAASHRTCPTAADAAERGCCGCYSDEGGGDPEGNWDNGHCCGHCTAVCMTPGHLSSCNEVACPSGSSGTDLPSGCTCNPGHSGTVTATEDAPYWRGTCTPVPCPSHSTGTGVPLECLPSVCTGCACNPSFVGDIVPSSISPFYSGSCEPDESRVAIVGAIPAIQLGVPVGALSTDDRHTLVTGIKQFIVKTLVCIEGSADRHVLVWDPDSTCDPEVVDAYQILITDPPELVAFGADCVPMCSDGQICEGGTCVTRLTGRRLSEALDSYEFEVAYDINIPESSASLVADRAQHVQEMDTPVEVSFEVGGNLIDLSTTTNYVLEEGALSQITWEMYSEHFQEYALDPLSPELQVRIPPDQKFLFVVMSVAGTVTLKSCALEGAAQTRMTLWSPTEHPESGARGYQRAGGGRAFYRDTFSAVSLNQVVANAPVGLESGTPICPGSAGIPSRLGDYCCPSSERAGFRVRLDAGTHLLRFSQAGLPCETYAASDCGTDLFMQWEEGIECPASDSPAFVAGEVCDADSGGSPETPSDSVLPENPVFTEDVTTQGRYGPYFSYSEPGTQYAPIEHGYIARESMTSPTTMGERRIELPVTNSGNAVMRVQWPTSCIPRWAAVSAITADGRVLVPEDDSGLQVAAGTSATLIITLHTSQLDAGEENAETATIRFELRGYPCEGSARQLAGRYFDAVIRFETYIAPLTVVAVPQTFTYTLPAGQTKTFPFEIFNVKATWLTYFIGGCASTMEYFTERMGPAAKFDGEPVPEWIQINTGPTTMPDVPVVNNQWVASLGPNAGPLTPDESNAIEEFMSDRWRPVLDADACANMAPSGTEPSVFNMTIVAPNATGHYLHSLHVFGGPYPGDSSGELDEAGNTNEFTAAQRLNGRPWLQRADLNSWQIDITLTVTPAAVSVASSTIEIVGDVRVGHEVTIVNMGHGCVEAICTGEASPDPRCSEKGFLVTGFGLLTGDPTTSTDTFTPDKVRRASPRLDGNDQVIDECPGPTFGIEAGQLMFAFVNIMDRFGNSALHNNVQSHYAVDCPGCYSIQQPAPLESLHAKDSLLDRCGATFGTYDHEQWLQPEGAHWACLKASGSNVPVVNVSVVLSPSGNATGLETEFVVVANHQCNTSTSQPNSCPAQADQDGVPCVEGSTCVCGPGQGKPSGSTVCDACVAGQYSTGDSGCVSCPAGHYSGQVGAFECSECPRGQRSGDLQSRDDAGQQLETRVECYSCMPGVSPRATL
eukprot:SAG22_NODE_37_length_26837_cov_8.103523_3_plen_1698_part_00